MQTKTLSLTRILLLCGAIAGPLFILTVLIQDYTRPAFNPRLQPLSLLSLGEWGWVQIVNFVLAGVLNLLYAGGLWRRLHPGRAGTWGPLLSNGVTGAAECIERRACSSCAPNVWRCWWRLATPAQPSNLHPFLGQSVHAIASHGQSGVFQQAGKASYRINRVAALGETSLFCLVDTEARNEFVAQGFKGRDVIND